MEGGSQKVKLYVLVFPTKQFRSVGYYPFTIVSLTSVTLIFEKLHKCLIGHLFTFKDSIKGDKVSNIWPLCKYNKKKKRSFINAKYSSTTNTHIL